MYKCPHCGTQYEDDEIADYNGICQTCDGGMPPEYYHPDNNSEEGYYVAETSQRETNPIHASIIYYHSPGSVHNQKFNASYEGDEHTEFRHLSEFHYIRLVRKIDMAIINTSLPAKAVNIKKQCTCKGFFRPSDCPVHGRKQSLNKQRS